MATLPGVPMLAHGQIEGYAEKYGMEYCRAVLDEQPDPGLLERHERELFPLFRRRAWFAEATDFLLYDLIKGDGTVDQQVFAYSNGVGPTRSLVIYHDRLGTTAGTIRRSAAYLRKSPSGARQLVRRSLAEGLGLPDDPDVFIRCRDARTGLEHVRSCRDVWQHGLSFSLSAHEGHVFWEFSEVRDDSAGRWRRLTDALAGRGVPSLESAMHELRLDEPLQVSNSIRRSSEVGGAP
ncbi:MAG: hypothetical protein H0U58_01125 [Chloroflexi bacterium]|nr:hypothetical protein [Chloroflexota bacterium]